MGVENGLFIFERIKEFNGRDFIVWKSKTYSYSWLNRKINFFLDVLKKKSIKGGSIVGIDADYSPSVIALFLALAKNRCVVVPLTSAKEEQKEEFIKIADVQYIFKFDKNDKFEVVKAKNKVANKLLVALIQDKEPGLVLFSSGSAGKIKAVLHNFSKLIKKFEQQRYGFRTLVFLLLDHIGGINTLFYALCNGGAIVYSKSRNPEDICRLIEKYKVELLPTTPTFLNLLILSEQYKNFDLSSLKVISYGTEVMPETTLKKLNKIFPNVKLQQTYGLSEVGILHSKSKDSKSLFMKVGGEGFQTKIVDGKLWIKADSAMLGYLNEKNPFDKDKWLNTGDIVVSDGEFIRILGRESDIINVGGQKVYPAEVEDILLQIKNIKDAIVKGEKNPILGNIVTARINLYKEESRDSLMKKIKNFCRGKLEPYKIPIKAEISTERLYGARFKRMRR